MAGVEVQEQQVVDTPITAANGETAADGGLTSIHFYSFLIYRIPEI